MNSTTVVQENAEESFLQQRLWPGRCRCPGWLWWSHQDQSARGWICRINLGRVIHGLPVTQRRDEPHCFKGCKTPSCSPQRSFGARPCFLQEVSAARWCCRGRAEAAAVACPRARGAPACPRRGSESGVTHREDRLVPRHPGSSNGGRQRAGHGGILVVQEEELLGLFASTSRVKTRGMHFFIRALPAPTVTGGYSHHPAAF